MAVHKRGLCDYIDPQCLQWLQDRFTSMTKIAVTVTDGEGRRLTQTSRVHTICDMLLNSRSGRALCKKSMCTLCKTEGISGEPLISFCPHTGLTVASVPIVLENRRMGSFIVGQMRTREPSEQMLGKLSGKLDRPSWDIYKILCELPIISMEYFHRIFGWLQQLTQSIARLRTAGKDYSRRPDRAELAVCITDSLTGKILEASESFAGQAGLSAESTVGRTCRSITGNSRENFCLAYPAENAGFHACGQDKSSGIFECYSDKCGKWFRCCRLALPRRNGETAHLLTRLDITEEKTLEQACAGLISYDNLLNIPNYRQLQKDLQQEMTAGEKQYLICFDIVDLRQFNDVYGWDMGDKFLEAVTDWALHIPGASKTFYRIGDSVFCLRLKNISEEKAERTARRIIKRFAKTWNIQTDEKKLSYFCGTAVALLRADEKTDLQNIRSAIERTLFLSRRDKQLTVYDRERDSREKEKRFLAMSLKNCVRQDMQGFDVHYQPIVEPVTGIWKALEALCRWECPEKGTVSPKIFIPEAERRGLIEQIGEWVLEKAVKTCKKLNLDKHDDFFLSVNISPIQIMEPEFALKVERILKRHRYPAAKLNLEVTESSEFTGNEHTASLVRNLRRNGVTMAIDDFGTGYSAFSNLLNLPVSYVKTEQTFVSEIEHNCQRQYFYYFLSEFSHARGMKLIAEGVETRQQLETVLKNGADYIQGYLFSSPLTENKLEKNLGNFLQARDAVRPQQQKGLDFEQWLNGKAAHRAAPGMFKIIQQCMHCLLARTGLDEALEKVLEITGNYCGVPEAFIFFKDGFPAVSQVYEWHRDDVVSQKHLLTGNNFSILEEHLMPAIRKDGIIIFPAGESQLPLLAEAFRMAELRSMAAVPVRHNRELMGFVGFGSRTGRQWRPDELLMLWNLAIMVQSTVEKEYLLEKIREKNLLQKSWRCRKLKQNKKNTFRQFPTFTSHSLRLHGENRVHGKETNPSNPLEDSFL